MAVLTKTITCVPGLKYVTDPTLAYVDVLKITREGMAQDIQLWDGETFGLEDGFIVAGPSTRSRLVVYLQAFGIFRFYDAFNSGEKVKIDYQLL